MAARSSTVINYPSSDVIQYFIAYAEAFLAYQCEDCFYDEWCPEVCRCRFRCCKEVW